MRDIIRKPKSWIAGVAVVIILLSLIVNLFSSTKTNLPQYVTESPEPTESAPEIIDMEYTQFQSDIIPLSMTVPAEWTYVVQDGCPTYINKNDGAKISFNIGDYVPFVNNYTEETLYNDVINSGGMWGGYTQLDYSSYLVIYELSGMDFFELTTWDLNNTVRVQIAIPAERYNYYYDTVIYLFDSFVWEKQSPLPDNFFLHYNDYGNFEFGIPASWESNITDGLFVAVNPETGSEMSVTIYGSTSDFSNVSELDYISAASQNKNNYLLSTYTNTGTSIVSEATFNSNGQQYAIIHNMLYNDGFVYEFTFQCLTDYYSTDGSTYMTAINLFRFFD